MMMRILALVVPLLCAAGLAQAQSSTVRVRGTIDTIGGNTMQVTDRGGERLTVALAPDLAVTAIVPARVEDIKDGTVIGTAALPGPEGSLRAIEVHIIPGRHDASYGFSVPFDLAPQSTMTNGFATNVVVVGTSRRTLTVRYKGGEKSLVVPPGVPVVTFAAGGRDMLVPGAHVNFTAQRAADGTLRVVRIGVGKDGLVPPM